jgi:hypothetical protein
MPPKAIASMAKKFGISKDKVEDAWEKIKKNVVGVKLKSGTVVSANSDKWTGEVWGYVMGSLRNVLPGMSKTKESISDEIINKVLEGNDPFEVINNLIDVKDRIVNSSDYQRVRTFFDPFGDIVFATEENVQIDPESNSRLIEIKKFIENINSEEDILDNFEEDILDNFENFFGSITELEEIIGRAQRTSRRPRLRKHRKKSQAFDPVTGKRKDPKRRLLARKTARRFASKRKAASRRFARSSKGKAFFRKLGSLSAKVR